MVVKNSITEIVKDCVVDTEVVVGVVIIVDTIIGVVVGGPSVVFGA